MLIQNTTTIVAPVWSANENSRVSGGTTSHESVAPVAQHAPEARQPSAEELEDAVKTLNQSMRANNSSLAFSVDQDTQQTVVSVLDSQTGEVIKQFPSKEAIAISKAIGEIQQGLLLKQKA